MIDKIKEQILHILRKLCGYYGLELNYGELELCNNDIATQYERRAYELFNLDDKINRLESKLESKNLEYDILSAQHEAKILEYDILDNKYKTIVDVYTNNRTLNNHYDIEEIVKVGVNENSYNYKKYLIAELEQILAIMKEKGIHPQDLIKGIINKAKRDLKE